MIKKTILPLFTTTLMFFGTQTIYSVESKKDDLEIGTTAKSSATTGSPFLAQGNVADLRLQRTMAKLMPQDEKAFQALTRYTGGDWNPLEPIDEEGLLEMVKYESNLKAKLSKIMAKVLQDPELRGENPPLLLSSSLPIPGREELPVQAKMEDDPMPKYNTDLFMKQGFPDQLVRYAYFEIYPILESRYGNEGLTVENLTSEMVNFSRGKQREWPDDILKTLATNIINNDWPKYDDWPIYNENCLKKNGVPDQMLRHCYEIIYPDLAEVAGHVFNVSADMLAQTLIAYSQTHKKGWPEDKLKRIAAHIVNLDEIEEKDDQKGDKKDANHGDSDKK